jgi:Bifunctional DNA primase/polymerase, N-terminal
MQKRTSLEGITHLRRGLATHGYRVTPVKGKDACMPNWPTARWNAGQMAGIARNYPDATNTGLVCGELVGLDIDTPDQETADAIRAMVAQLPGFVAAPYRIGKAPKCLYAFRATEPRDKLTTSKYIINGHDCQLEVFGRRSQFVAYGIHPGTLAPYEWHNGSPAETPFADLPEITPEAIDALLQRAEAYFAERGALKTPPSKPREGSATSAVSDHPWAVINSRALAKLGAWVPDLQLQKLKRYQSGYMSIASFRPTRSTTATRRIRSLSVQPQGIYDHSAKQGYSPIDLVAVCLSIPEPLAVEWLRARLGITDAPAVNVAGLLAQPLPRAAANLHCRKGEC